MNCVKYAKYMKLFEIKKRNIKFSLFIYLQLRKKWIHEILNVL